MKLRHFTIGILLTSLATSFANESEKPAANSVALVERAERIIGQDVTGGTNALPLAELEDLLVDLESGRIIYAILDLDMSRRDVAVPIELLKGNGRTFEFTGDMAKLSDAPLCSNEPELRAQQRGTAFLTRVNQHFDRANEISQARALFFARELPGMAVRGASGGKIGEVENLALDLKAHRIAFVIVAPERSLKFDDRLLALPPGAFNQFEHSALGVTASLEQLSSAPGLKRGDWASLSDRSWGARVYQHFGKEFYFQTEQLEPTSESRPPRGSTNRLEKIYHEPQKD